MHLADWRIAGLLPLQDHNPAASIGDRKGLAAVRVHATVVDGDEDPTNDTEGDVLGGFLWEEAAGGRDYVNAWWLSGASVVATAGAAGDGTPGGSVPADPVLWSPIRTEAIDPDTRLPSKLLAAAPSWFDGVWPKGWTGSAAAGSEETSQEDLLHPAFWGLVAPSRKGNPRAGTPVFDIDENGLPDRFARLQSALSVVSFDVALTGLGLPIGKALALQLGPARLEETPGYALWVDHEHGEIGCGRVDQGGPLTTGRGSVSCPHTNLGDDDDGNNVQPLHFAAGDGDPCGTLWLYPGVGDGPLLFDSGAWVAATAPTGADDWREVKLRFNTELGHSIGGNAYTGVWQGQVNIAGGAAGGGAGYLCGGFTGLSDSSQDADFGRLGLLSHSYVTPAPAGAFGTNRFESIGSIGGPSLSNGDGGFAYATGLSHAGATNDILWSFDFLGPEPLPPNFSEVGAGGLKIRLAIQGLTGAGATISIRIFVFDPADITNTQPLYGFNLPLHGPFESTNYSTDQNWFTFQVDQADLTGIWAAGDRPAFMLLVQAQTGAAGFFDLSIGDGVLDLTG